MPQLLQPPYWKAKTRKPYYWPFLWLASGVYYLATLWRRAFAKPVALPIKSICVGNAIAGGAGKTPTLLALARLLGEDKIVFLTRGFGGTEEGPILAHEKHEFQDIGDEAMLLKAHAPTIIAKDRVAGAKLAAELFGHTRVLLLDDGLQNPHFHCDLNLLVWDEFGQGNGHMIPAGPLRLPMKQTLAMTNLVVSLADQTPPKMPAFSAHGMIERLETPQTVYAFAGIGRPEKFKLGLKKAGYHIKSFGIFPDHHVFTEADITPYYQDGIPTLTTEKDFVRLPAQLKSQTMAVPYVIHFAHPQAVKSWLVEHLGLA